VWVLFSKLGKSKFPKKRIHKDALDNMSVYLPLGILVKLYSVATHHHRV